MKKVKTKSASMLEEDEATIEMLPTKKETPQHPTDEGDGQVTKTTKRSPAMELRDDSISSRADDDDDDDISSDDALTKFLDGDRPTSAGEPSHNVPRKLVINPWCISTCILLLSLTITILITIFAPSLFESAIQSMLHYMVDINTHNNGQGGFEITNLFMIFFCIFNTCVFAMCGNIDYLLMVCCGYLYGDDSHEWLTGAAVYIIANYIGCCVTFAIGRTLFKDKLYFLFSKYEKYRYFQRAVTDYSLLLSMALNLNPFLPSGLIVYGLSISSMSWMYFLIGQASRIPNVAIMAYAGYYIRNYMDNEPIENTNIDVINISDAYKCNPYTYGFTVTFCVLFAILLLATTFAVYLQFQRLVFGDALKKREENSSSSSSDSSVTDSKSLLSSSSSSDISGNTLDEYGFPNEKHVKFLFDTPDGNTNPNTNTNEDYNPPNNNKTIGGDSDSNPNLIDDDTYSGGYGGTGGDIEMQELKKENKTKSVSKKHKKKRKKKKKKSKLKKRKLNNKIWQTIVLATSPTEENSMLFEEGPKYKNKNGQKNVNPNGNNNYFGGPSSRISVETRNENGKNEETNGGDKAGKNGKNGKNGKVKSPRSLGKFNFLKKNTDDKNVEASSPKAGQNNP